MKAAVYDKYGGPEVLYLADVEKPTPGPKEILVKLDSVSVTIADSRIRGANFPTGFAFFARLIFGMFKPKNRILGSSFSGIVQSIGSEVTKFKVGDEVLGMNGLKMSAYAEFLTISEKSSVILKPSEITHEEAAGFSFGGTTALFFLRDQAKIKQGDSILINGASGAVGTNAIQLAKYYGAEVTAVCSTKNIELVKELGADHVIDYTKENFLNSAKKYDLVMDAVGNISIPDAKKVLKEVGTYLLVVAGMGRTINAAFNKRGGQKVLDGTSSEKKADLEFLANLVKEKKLKVVIDKVFPFEDIVQANVHVDSGRKVGNVIVKIAS